jgi:hypothetical protein
MINIYQQSGHHIGDTLMAMCWLNSLNQPVHITTNPTSWYITWKSIFNLDQITITINDNATDPVWINPPHIKFTESFKWFSRYLQPNNVTLFGQQFEVGRRNKKCVGVFINNGDHVKDTEFFNRIDTVDIDEYPYYKYHSKAVYDFMLDLIQASGYDPIIIDHKDISIEHKVFMLNELCDFVIGYEGGMCHLAHALDIPTIILPLRIVRMPGDDYLTDWLHLDKKTYFLRKIEEIYTWTPAYLLNLIDGLYNEVDGNNQWLTNPTNIMPLLNYFNGSSEEFYKQLAWTFAHMHCPTIGGF